MPLWERTARAAECRAPAHRRRRRTAHLRALLLGSPRPDGGEQAAALPAGQRVTWLHATNLSGRPTRPWPRGIVFCLLLDSNLRLLPRLKQLLRRPFVRNVGALATGTAAAQAISMAFAPVTTRLYGPEAYGVQGVFLSVAGIAATVAALTFPIAIVLPKSDMDARGLVKLSLFVSAGMSTLVALLLFFFGRPLLALLNAESIVGLAWLIPVYMLFSVLNDTAGQWLIRRKAFRLSARISVSQALLAGGSKIGIGAILPSAKALIVINNLALVLHAAMIAIGLRRRPLPPESRKTRQAARRPNLWSLAKRHRDFPMLRAPQVLLNSASRNLPSMMLAAFFGPAAVGFYAIANTVLGIPTALIGGAVGQVFYPRINEAAQTGEPVRKLILKATLGLAAVGIVPYATIIVAGPWLFALVFGGDWATAGTYARWLSLQYLNRPAVAAVPVLELQGGLLLYEVFSTGSKIAALALGHFVWKSDIAAIALFSIAGVAAYAFLILWVIHHSGTVRRPLPPRAESKPEMSDDVAKAS